MHAPIKVSLSELQLSPSAFDLQQSENCTGPNSDVNQPTQKSFCPRDTIEVWLDHASTSRRKNGIDKSGDTSSVVNTNDPPGAWWPGRVLAIQGEFAHVEVAAPIEDLSGVDDQLNPQTIPQTIGFGSTAFPYRSILLKVKEIRSPWNGRSHVHSSNTLQTGSHLITSGPVAPSFIKESLIESFNLLSPGILHRHSICIPAYLSRLASSAESHSSLIKFCGAPCLIQCDTEPFLPDAFAKNVFSTSKESQKLPQNSMKTESSVTNPLFAPTTYTWPSPALIAESTASTPGTLSQSGITDPALLLSGLPRANGPLILLHIWSGSFEAIRRASLLELGHVRILAFRYHVLRNLSKGETGELDLSGSVEADPENGDAPAMHCKPITIPILSPDKTPSRGMMIGYEGHFRIPPHLTGLAIGYRGSTIQSARGLPGVRTVDLLQDGVVRVVAETVDGCQAVRNLLDFTEAEIPVSPRLASRLIGSKGMNIRSMADSAGVRRASLLDPLERKRNQLERLRKLSITSDNEHINSASDADADQTSANEDPSGGSASGKTNHLNGDSSKRDPKNNPSNADEVPDKDLPPPAFYLLGTRMAVAKMRLLLEFQAENWNELDELEETRRNLCSQLRQINQTSGKSEFQPPVGSVNGKNPRNASGPHHGRNRRPPEKADGVNNGPDFNRDQSTKNHGKNTAPNGTEGRMNSRSGGVSHPGDGSNRRISNGNHRQGQKPPHNSTDVSKPKQEPTSSRGTTVASSIKH